MYCFFFEEPNKNGITYISPTMYGGFLPHPYEDIEYPDIYLNFCKEDIKQDDKRAITNALSNCKRAIHLRIDLLLNQYGLLCKNENCDFPQKLDLINSVGLLPTLILKGINDERNLLEHRYKIPDKVRVCEAIDAAELLYLATGKILSNTPIEAIIGFDVEPIHRVMRINPNTGELLFWPIVK